MIESGLDWIMKNMDKKLTVPKWVLIFRPKIPQMPQKVSAQNVCPSQKLRDFWKKNSVVHDIGLGSSIGHWLWGMQLQSYIWPQRLLAELKDKWESQLAPYGMSALAPIWRSRETDFLSIRAWPSCSCRPLRHETKLDSHNQDFWNTVHCSGTFISIQNIL